MHGLDVIIRRNEEAAAREQREEREPRGVQYIETKRGLVPRVGRV